MTNEELRARLEIIVPILLSDVKGRRRRTTRTPLQTNAWATMLDLVGDVVRQVARRSENEWMDAEDLVQRIALKLQDQAVLERLERSDVPLAYLRGLARYTLIDVARERAPTVPLSEVSEPAGGSGSESEVEPEVDRRLQRLLSALPASDRRLLQMRFWEGRTVADIARELREPYSRVAVRLFRLIERLKRSGLE